MIVDNIDVKIIGEPEFVPTYSTEEAAGADLRANIVEDLILAPMERALVDTGLHMEIPFGYEGQIRPRSGLAAKHGISIVNSPGTIDSDYRGPVKVILVNLSNVPYSISRGERIGQIVFAPVIRATFSQTPHLETSERGAGGFGSTGK